MTDLEFTVPDLLQGKEYLFKVCAQNSVAPGEPAYVDEPNMSAPASEYILDNFLPNLCYLFLFLFFTDLLLATLVWFLGLNLGYSSKKWSPNPDHQEFTPVFALDLELCHGGKTQVGNIEIS